MRVAINGFGRIGRSVFRILDRRRDIEVVAINDLFEPEVLRYLLQHDTVMGSFDQPLALDGKDLLTPNGSTHMLRQGDTEALPWRELAIDIVVEASGALSSREQVTRHLSAGASRAILTVPAKDEIDHTVVLGVNEAGLKPEHRIISNASCTTNCLAPMAKLLHDNFGIVEGLINTVHAYTNDQRLADVPHTDWRRSRAAAANIIPTSTGAARAVGQVLPALAGKLDGIATRVPVTDGSVVDLYVELENDVAIEDVHQAVAEAAAGPMRGIVQSLDRPVVSSDIIGNPHSSIYDPAFTAVTRGRFLKTLNWYDNEWGYANRVCDLIALMSAWD